MPNESGFQMPLSIKDVVEKISAKKYFLPAIQREFVWKPEQVIKLFDSLMRGYPIGSFLYWKVDKEKVKDFQFYEFIKDYHERNNTHNPKADITGDEDVIAILDGQQRLTALNIALKGSYSTKQPRMFKNNPRAYPRRKLYLNLLAKPEEYEMKYNFQFLTEEESERDEKNYWFEVGKVISFQDIPSIYNFLRDENLIENKEASDTLCKLFEILTRKIINYYLEDSQELEKVLNIFIRVNSGGTILSYSDLLLSIASAQWDTKDARKEITEFVDEINEIGNNFEFDKDFVLKSCLILSDINDIAFKVDNFNSENMKKIEDLWDKIKISLRLAIELIDSYGYNGMTLTSTNAVIPIAYHIFNKENPQNFVLSQEYREDRIKIKQWLLKSLLKRVFSGQPDNVLRPIRNLLRESTIFPYDEILEKFKGSNKTLIFTEEDIDALLFSKYGQAHTFSVLALLYPTLDYRNQFHQDHIFPKSWFTPTSLRKKGVVEEDIEYYLENFNYLGNLQFLEGIPNEEKSNNDFKEWFEKNNQNNADRESYKDKHYIPVNISLDFTNFKEFLENRNKLLYQELSNILL